MGYSRNIFNKNVCMVGVTSNFVGLFEENAKQKMGGGVVKNMPPPPPHIVS